MAYAGRYPNCFDPYLRYAISSHFKDFEFFDEGEGFRLLLLVEFKIAGQAAAFERDMNAALAGPFVHVSAVANGALYATMRARTKAVTEASPRSALFRIWNAYVSRVELSLPLKPTPAKALAKRMLVLRRGLKPRDTLLIGVLDDGCPFAARQFLRARAPASTRVRAIWDQNHDRRPVQIKEGGKILSFGEELSDFNYGLEYRRESVALQIGLDDWMKRHSSNDGIIDEDGCYADACFKSLRLRETHGAHVMDVLAGDVSPAARVGPTQPHTDHRDPPSWAAGQDAACAADIVFVQFPESGIRDATGVWLKAYVLDGIRYILSFAGPRTKQVVVNLSYGPTTGPHDGTAVLEKALSALVDEYDGSGGKPKLDIFLAAGNSYLTDGHVFFVKEKTMPDRIEWIWRLPPDNSALCFAEVWMKTDHVNSRVKITLTAPDGSARPLIGPIAWGDNTMWLLQVGPTIVMPGVHAHEHGDYTIRVEDLVEGAQVDAYVARTDPNLGVISPAKSSCFVDPRWEETRSAAAGCTYVNGEFDNAGSLVSRFGTLNGIATNQNPSVHVAAGDMLMFRDGRKAPYSSAGPARPPSARVGPDYALFSDESYALEGVRAGGTRSGAVFRLVGTSAAAPQLARWVADGRIPPATHVPPPLDSREKEKRGRGDVRPP